MEDFSVNMRRNASIISLVILRSLIGGTDHYTQALQYIQMMHGLNTPVSIESQAGGSSAQSSLYRVTCNNKQYIVRLLCNESQIDKKREVKAVVSASRYQYGPFVYGWNDASGWIVMRYIEDHKLELDDATKVQALAHMLKKIHTGDTLPCGIPILDQCRYRIENAKKNISSDDLQLLHDVVADVESVMAAHPVLETSCHRDLHTHNIMYDTSMKAIDFENAAQDDPYFDIATVGICQIPQVHEVAFLTHYFDKQPSQEEFHRYTLFKQLALAYFACPILEKVSPIKQPKQTKSFRELLDRFNQRDPSMQQESNQWMFAQSMLDEIRAARLR